LKNISILGSTGSIGRQTLEVISDNTDKYNVVGLACGGNLERLREQIIKYKPALASVKDRDLAEALKAQINGSRTEIVYGEEGAARVASHEDADTVVSAMVGASGLKPTLSAVRAGKDIALANKETLVIAGEIITKEAKENNVTILPVDSEHSALFQALQCGDKKDVKRLILTASGGPFLDTPAEELRDVTPEVALNHPTWIMGKKITIDSATLMNKGFEVIEARWLFGLGSERISVWIHPQSIVHSMVEYIDGSIISQMGIPDMRIPISYALSYPYRTDMRTDDARPEDFTELSFREADFEKFPSLALAFGALREGGTMPSVMNGANEVAVDAFLRGQIGFTEIIKTVDRVMGLHNKAAADTLEAVTQSDKWARNMAESLIKN
jgi:1-deoxy-D-xylulose-5-phosphate reductoisomerase